MKKNALYKKSNLPDLPAVFFVGFVMDIATKLKKTIRAKF